LSHRASSIPHIITAAHTSRFFSDSNEFTFLPSYSADHRHVTKHTSFAPPEFIEPGSKFYNGVQPFSATEKFLEIVGPPNLARFIRSSLLCRCCRRTRLLSTPACTQPPTYCTAFLY
jgi:hypothetical protein